MKLDEVDFDLILVDGEVVSSEVVGHDPVKSFFWMDQLGRSHGYSTYGWVAEKLASGNIGGVHICWGNAPGRIDDSFRFIPVSMIKSISQKRG